MEDLEFVDIYYIDLGAERIKCLYINASKKMYQIKYFSDDDINDVQFNASMMKQEIFDALVLGLSKSGFTEVK
ncbi:MAG: hypothetical protein VZS44_11035 [Bacilli bacterium]|nr:hypothetical protein [Bacilli bacterium]